MEQHATMGEIQDPLLDDNGCGSQAHVRVCVRPLHASDYVDAQLCSSVRFDVILQLAEPPENSSSARKTSTPSSPLLHIQRCLHDFAQLERELQQDTKSGDGDGSAAGAGVPSIIPAIKAYLASRGNDDALATVLYGQDSDMLLFEARLAWQLELFVSSLIAHSNPQVSCSYALKKFISGGSLSPLSPVKKNVLDNQEKIETLFEGIAASAVVHERIPSGCTVEHATRVQVTQNSAFDESEGVEAPANQQALVLWRFASQGDHVVFSARFTEKQLQHNEQVGSNDDARETESYNAVGSADLWSTGGDDAAEPVHNVILDDEDSPMEQYMAQYRTWCSFVPAAQDETTSPQYVYGAFLAKTSGELVLEWENADTTSVLSKPLKFQVCMSPLLLGERNDAGVEAVLKTLLIGRGEAQHQSGDASWVCEAVMASKIMSLEHILDQRDDDDDSDDDVDFRGSDSLENVPHNSRNAGGDLGRDTKEQFVRLQEEKHFHEQRAKEFEERVFQLEEALLTTKKELQKAHDDIAISEEIYKASLEAITQLEVAASVSQLKPPIVANASGIPPLLPASSQNTGVAEDTKDEDPGPAMSSSSSSPVTEKEHQRVVNLCTTFQEQCLWRSIELAESEKRSMALEGKLQNTEQEKSELQGQIAAQEEQINSLQTENKKLRTHKSILVQEVKKLQPYSQINLAALVQDAQEARMMQRSLQAQLDSRNTSEIVVSASTSSSVATEEDGAGGGFVVVESEDHSSP